MPKQVFAHGFLLARGEKMSKSLGNVVDPMELADRFGVDALRYFLLREVTFGQDGSYSAEAIVNRVNAELANSFGNLAQRTLSMIFKNLDGMIPSVGDAKEDKALLRQVDEACAQLTTEFGRFGFSAGLEAWMTAVFACNAYVDAAAPWALRKTDPTRMAGARTLVVAIRQLAARFADHPRFGDRLLTLIDGGQGGQPIAQPQPIFPRLELPAEEGEAQRRPHEADRQPLPPQLRGPRQATGRGPRDARAAGVTGFLNISTRQREWNDVIAVAEANADVWATVGSTRTRRTPIPTLEWNHLPTPHHISV